MKPPYNAQQIIDLRAKGKRPADMILVSLVGWLGEVNPCVTAREGVTYDWRFIRGLDALIVTTTKDKAIRDLVRAVLAEQPNSLGVWFADKQGGSWLLIEGYKPLTKLLSRMGSDEKAAYRGIGSKKT